MTHMFSDLRGFRRDPLGFLLAKGACTNEPLVPLRIGFAPHYLVNDPELARSILKADREALDKGRLVRKLRPLIGDSFLISASSDHLQRRQVLHHQLARGVAQRYVPEMSAVIRKAAAAVSRLKSFKAHEVTAAIALDLICVALFGHNALSSGDKQALIGAMKLIEDELADEMFRATPLAPWSRYARQQRRRNARQMMWFVVNRIREHASDTSVLRSLAELDLTDGQIRDEIQTMLVAGHHTTGSAGAWLLYHLAMEPGLADEIAAEAQSICTEDGEIQPARLKDAGVSLAFAREVLRLYPSAWWFSRETRREVELAGQRVKRGTSLIISPWQLHRSARYWDHPERFDATRSHAGAAYMPFGAGPRVCVGMGVALLELQLLALEFASAFRLTCRNDQPVSWPAASVTLIPPEIEIEVHLRALGGRQRAAA